MDIVAIHELTISHTSLSMLAELYMTLYNTCKFGAPRSDLFQIHYTIDNPNPRAQQVLAACFLCSAST